MEYVILERTEKKGYITTYYDYSCMWIVSTKEDAEKIVSFLNKRPPAINVDYIYHMANNVKTFNNFIEGFKNE